MLLAKKLMSLGLFVVFGLLSFSAAAQLADKKVLTLEGAKKVAAAAEAEAKKNNWNVVIAVVDDGGNLLYLQRIDGTQTGSIEVAIQKARTAQAFKRPTKVFEDALAAGRTGILKLPGAIPIEGGIPFAADGRFLGAIGVSGAAPQHDGQVAEAGVEEFARMLLEL